MTPAQKRRRDQILGLGVHPPEPVEAKVVCNGKVHRILFDGKHLILLDHTHVGREKLLWEFGSRCRCLEVLRLWENPDPCVPPRRQESRLPTALRAPFTFWRESRRLSRLLRSRPTRPSPITEPRVIATVTALLGRRGYTHLPNASRFVRVSLSSQPKMTGHWCRCPRPGHWKRRLPHNLRVAVKADWLEKVYLRGWGILDDRFVVDAVTAEEIRYEVTRNAHGLWHQTPWWYLKGVTPEKAPYFLIEDPTSCFVCPVIARRVEASRGHGERGMTWEIVSAARNGSRM